MNQPSGQPSGQPSAEPVDVPLRDESIRLGQFLKLADAVDSGADAKPLLAEGAVLVNGEVETRRGRQLVKGDVVSLPPSAGRGAASYRVS
jgi:ribosome-associated protein